MHRITGEIEAYSDFEAKANETQRVQLHFGSRSGIWSGTNVRPPRFTFSSSKKSDCHDCSVHLLQYIHTFPVHSFYYPLKIAVKE